MSFKQGIEQQQLENGGQRSATSVHLSPFSMFVELRLCSKYMQTVYVRWFFIWHVFGQSAYISITHSSCFVVLDTTLKQVLIQSLQKVLLLLKLFSVAAMQTRHKAGAFSNSYRNYENIQVQKSLIMPLENLSSFHDCSVSEIEYLPTIQYINSTAKEHV